MKLCLLFNLFIALTLSPLSFADVAVEAQAPDFSAQGHDGKTYKLSDFKGKTVVLEWFNNGCPYVEKHYGSENMQNLQKKYMAKDVVWLSVASSKKGAQGYLDTTSAKQVLEERKAQPTAMLLDASGKIGKLYGAQTTPHMFVITPDGKVAYQGAIDSNSSSRKSTIKDAENYVVAALDAVLAGKSVKTKSTQPYGCSVKY